MRLAWVVVAGLVGCGRIAFDPQSDGGGTVGDASVDAAIDAPPGPRIAMMVNQSGGQPAFLYRLDLDQAKATMVGQVWPTDVTGLARGGANTLYGTTYDGRLLEITLSPFAVVDLQAIPLALVGFEQEITATYVATSEATSLVHQLMPGTPWVVTSRGSLREVPSMAALSVDGGDIARAANGTTYLWTNATRRLYTLSGRDATRIEPGEAVGEYVPGLVFRGGNLYGISRDTDELFKIDPVTGVYGPRTIVCEACPTQLDIENADLCE